MKYLKLYEYYKDSLNIGDYVLVFPITNAPKYWSFGGIITDINVHNSYINYKVTFADGTNNWDHGCHIPKENIFDKMSNIKIKEFHKKEIEFTVDKYNL